MVARWAETFEPHTRWMTTFGRVILLVGGVLFLGAQIMPQTRTLEAERFVLRDKDGNMRGSFEVVDGTATLALRDPHEEECLRLQVMPDGSTYVKLRALWKAPTDTARAALALFDQKSVCRVSVGINPDGGISLDLFDEAAKLRSSFGLSDRGAPYLQLQDRTENIIAKLP